MFFRKFVGTLHAFFTSIRCSASEEMLAAHLQAKRALFRPAGSDAPLIAVASLPDPLYYGILGEIISGLRQRRPLRVDQLDTLSLLPGAGHSLAGFIRARILFNNFSRRKWERLYATFCNRVGYRSASWIGPLRTLRHWRQAWLIWRSLGDKDQLATISHDGIVIGDLVIDTYLRMRPAANIALSDRYLLLVIRQALKEIDLAFRYFRRDRPSVLLSTYAVYVQHGVPVRVALACGIKVLTFGNLQEFFTPISFTNHHHTKDSKRYSANFDAMPDRSRRLDQAAQALEARLSGRINSATAYMKKSAYAVTRQEVPDVRGATVIFLHDFYDSVHIYPWILFHDFWEWVCFTIETLQAAGQDFWIKPHPNQAAQSSVEIETLRTKYPGVKFLPTDITNRQLADAGMACAVTVYGSVAPEMGFLGIPSISTGDSPHASFDAFHLARTRQDYAALLTSPPQPGADKDRLKAQACAFYYMHNLNLSPDNTLLRDRFVAVWAHLLSAEANTCFDAEKTTSVLAAMTDNAAFQHFSDTLLCDHHS